MMIFVRLAGDLAICLFFDTFRPPRCIRHRIFSFQGLFPARQMQSSKGVLFSEGLGIINAPEKSRKKDEVPLALGVLPRPSPIPSQSHRPCPKDPRSDSNPREKGGCGFGSGGATRGRRPAPAYSSFLGIPAPGVGVSAQRPEPHGQRIHAGADIHQHHPAREHRRHRPRHRGLGCW